MEFLKALDVVNPFLGPNEKAKVQERLGKNPQHFDLFQQTYPIVTLERRKQEIDEIREDIDRIKAEVSMVEYRSDMMARKSAIDKAEIHRKELKGAQTMVLLEKEEGQEWEHMIPASLKDHLEAVSASAPMQLPDDEFDMLTKEVDTENKRVIWRYADGDLPYWAKELPQYAHEGPKMKLTAKAQETLPGGWVPFEYEGKTLYVNHELQQTSWYPFPVLPMQAGEGGPQDPTTAGNANGLTMDPRTRHPVHKDGVLELDMKMLENRLASYTHAVNWPHKFHEAPRLSTLAMAECGFYYVYDDKVHDRVRCAYCNVELSQFKVADDPWVMHCIESPNCNFVKDGIPGINPATGQVAVGRQAIGRVRFEARHPDELSFQKGENITILYDAPDENWYVAEINGKKGVIPGTHIKFVKEGKDPNQKQPEPTAPTQPPSQFQSGQTGTKPSGQGPKDFVCTAIYDYTAKFNDELSFMAGQKIIVLPDPSEPGWYIGSLNGKKGLVPSTHVAVDDPKDSLPGFQSKDHLAMVPAVPGGGMQSAVMPQPAGTTGLYFPRESGTRESGGPRPPGSFGMSQAPASLEQPGSGSQYPLDPYGAPQPRYAPQALHQQQSQPNQLLSVHESLLPLPQSNPVAAKGQSSGTSDSRFLSSVEEVPSVKPDAPVSAGLQRQESGVGALPEKGYTFGLVFDLAIPERPTILRALQLMDVQWNLQDMPNYAAPKIMKGDILIEVDGVNVSQRSLPQVHGILRGEMNSLAELVFQGGVNSNVPGGTFTAQLRRHLRHGKDAYWEKTIEQLKEDQNEFFPTPVQSIDPGQAPKPHSNLQYVEKSRSSPGQSQFASHVRQ